MNIYEQRRHKRYVSMNNSARKFNEGRWKMPTNEVHIKPNSEGYSPIKSDDKPLCELIRLRALGQLDYNFRKIKKLQE